MFTKIHCENNHGWTSRVISSVSEVYVCIYVFLYIYIPVGKILCNLSKTIASIAQFRSRSQSRLDRSTSRRRHHQRTYKLLCRSTRDPLSLSLIPY